MKHSLNPFDEIAVEEVGSFLSTLRPNPFHFFSKHLQAVRLKEAGKVKEAR